MYRANPGTRTSYIVRRSNRLSKGRRNRALSFKSFSEGINFLFVSVGTFLAGASAVLALVYSGEQARTAQAQLAEERTQAAEERALRAKQELQEKEREATSSIRHVSIWRDPRIWKRYNLRNSNPFPIYISVQTIDLLHWGEKGQVTINRAQLGPCQEWVWDIVMPATAIRDPRLSSDRLLEEVSVTDRRLAWRTSMPYHKWEIINPDSMFDEEIGSVAQYPKPNKIKSVLACANP